MTARTLDDPEVMPYEAGSAGTAGRGYRCTPDDRPAPPLPRPRTAADAAKESVK